jgi:hypothetical protein
MARTKNDKRYEEEAEQFRIFRQANIGLSLEGLIVDAFRWYDARRERETCEWIYDKPRKCWSTLCGYYWPIEYVGTIYGIMPEGYCRCGRRIVEKEEK